MSEKRYTIRRTDTQDRIHWQVIDSQTGKPITDCWQTYRNHAALGVAPARSFLEAKMGHLATIGYVDWAAVEVMMEGTGDE